MKKIIVFLMISCLFGCSSNSTNIEEIPEKENITVSKMSLGQKETNIKPVILINDGEDTLYIGEKDYEFDVEAYSDNGKVEIAYDDSDVNFEATGTYNIKVLANDTYASAEDILSLSMQKKVVKQVPNSSDGNSYSGNANNNSHSGKGIYFSCFNRTFYSYEEFAAFINDPSTMMQEEFKQEILAHYKNIDFN